MAPTATAGADHAYRVMVETMSEGAITLLPDGAIAYCNQRFADMIKWDRSRVLGGRLKDLVASPDAARVESLIVEARSGAARGSLSLQRSDGTTIPVLMNLNNLGPDATEIVAVVDDLSEARESEARFRGLVEQEIAGIYIVAADGKIAYINPRFAHMFGYDPQEVVGRSFADFIVERDHELLFRRLAAEVAGEALPALITTALKRKDGTLVDVVGHSRPATHAGRPVSIGVLLDVTEQKKAEIALRRLNRTLATLSEANSAVVRATSESELMDAMCRVIVERGGYRLAWVGIPRNDAERSVKPVASAGDDRGYLQSARITWAEDDPRGSGITGLAIKTGLPQTNQDFSADRRMEPWRVEAARHGFAASAAFPLKDDGKVLAVVTLYSADIEAFNAEELALLQRLADDTAYGLRTLRARAAHEVTFQRWRSSLVDTIRAISNTSELRDPYTAGHQRRVAQLASAIARELKLPDEQVLGIYLSALIHDVGKVTIPSDLLTKPGKLTPLEYQLTQTHAQAGYEVVKGIDFPWPIAQVLLQHHERLDGSGYPNGLRSNEIIQEAKILAVADVVEAMMTRRPYRAELGIDAALAEIEKNKGILFDSSAVDACVMLFRKQDFRFE